MEAFEIGLLHQAFVSQAKMVFLLPLLLLILALLYSSESLVPTLWDAYTHIGLFQGPASAFLLLNCVIVTIIASSKLESTKGGIKEEGKESETIMIRVIKGDHERGAPIRAGMKQSDYNSSTCSTSGRRGRQAVVQGQWKGLASNDHVNEENTMNESSMQDRDRLVCTGSDRVGLSHNMKPTVREKKGLLRSSFSLNDLGMVGVAQLSHQHDHMKAHINLPRQKCKQLKRAAGYKRIDRPLMQAEDPAAAAAAQAAPSLEEVWAAIISNKTGDDHMASMQSSDQRPVMKTKYGIKDDTESAAAAAVASTAATAAAVFPPAVGTATAAFPPATAIEEKEVNDPDSEVEELNRRAEEFIARFNQQMRLQRQESLARKRRRRRCNDHEHRHMQLTPPGLLVG